MNSLHSWRLGQKELAHSIVAFLQLLEEVLVKIDNLVEV
jgi:hypothetical protein